MAEGARLESVFRGNSNVGSNPTLSASSFVLLYLTCCDTVSGTEVAHVNRQVNLTKRVRTKSGLRYCPVVLAANGRIKPN